MPLQTALDVASKVKFKTPKNPDIVLSLLRTQGFTKSQISKIVKQFPRLLFFLTLIELFCPNLNFCIPLGSPNEKVIKCLKRSPRAFRQVFPDKIAPNIELLRTSGVSDVLISSLVSNVPDSAFRRHSKFRSIVNQVRDMGFDPSKIVFVEAIRVLSGMSSLTWERKFKAYSKYGWSKDQTLLAFKKFPPCLSVSEEKIFKNMDFFVHKMGLMAVDIATKPTVMVFSLEKRIIPRCSVVQSLYSKGLLKKELSFASILHPTEKTFLEKYVTKFPKDATWLLHLYTGEVKIFDV
ncbi:Transcription termination factor MTERF15, mitochondrial, partial [Cucurbita argyrosperma subsp. sororia]